MRYQNIDGLDLEEALEQELKLQDLVLKSPYGKGGKHIGAWDNHKNLSALKDNHRTNYFKKTKLTGLGTYG